MEFNFLKYDLNKIDHLGADYDTCSVMHYGATAFAKVTSCIANILSNIHAAQSWGMKTIVPKHATKCKLGQRNGFSDTDVRKINTLYNCRGYPQVSSHWLTAMLISDWLPAGGRHHPGHHHAQAHHQEALGEAELRGQQQVLCLLGH